MKSLVAILAVALIATVLALPSEACDVGCGGGASFSVRASASAGFFPQQQLVYAQPQLVFQQQRVFVPQKVFVQRQAVVVAQPQVNVQVQNRGLLGGRLFRGRQQVNVNVR